MAVIAAIMVAAGSTERVPPLASLPLLGVALWMFRGCPTCWVIGLVATANCRSGKTAQQD
jgi:hypothetical protein